MWPDPFAQACILQEINVLHKQGLALGTGIFLCHNYRGVPNMEHTTVGHARDVAQSVEAFVLLLLQVSTLFLPYLVH